MTTTTASLDVLADAVQLACRAPSLHNCQPWRWVAAGGRLHLFADPGRVVRSSDSTGREALISCGAALHHLRVAMAAAGWSTTVARFPDPNCPEHLASIDFTTADRVTETQRERADAILRRRTDRLPFGTPSDWQSVHQPLRGAVERDGVILDVLPDALHAELVEVSRLTTALRRYDDAYHQELQWWTAPFRLSEGIPGSALISGSERRRVEANRQFPTSGYSERRIATTEDQAKILVLSTPGDTREEALTCGEALSAALLECTLAGLATCAVTHVTELADSRAVVGSLTGRQAVPQVLIRVGEAPALEDVPPTPRRPLPDVFEIRQRDNGIGGRHE